jgi:peptidoglycan L-alanyl-D-glutamate endopeptidase CwlK
MGYDREPRYLHPYITGRLPQIMEAINSKLPGGYKAKLVSAHRSPDDQFKLYKQGRVFRNGSWVKAGPVVTYLDGFIKTSRHNNLPCTAFDVGIFRNSAYLGDSTLYTHVKEGMKFGLDWGGNWSRFKDYPHLEMPGTLFFKNSLQKDQGLLWQQYLQMAGVYRGAMDGIFGEMSLKGLKNATGIDQRNLQAWDILYDRYGKLDKHYQ